MREHTPIQAFIRFTSLAAPALLALLISAIGAPQADADVPSLVESAVVAEIRSLINEERQARGMVPLDESADVDGVAAARALDMASNGYLDHVSPSGTNAVHLLYGGGVSAAYVGENIARCAGYALDEAIRIIHATWMASAGHRGNILDPRFRRVGVAIAIGDAVYFVAVFAD